MRREYRVDTVEAGSERSDLTWLMRFVFPRPGAKKLVEQRRIFLQPFDEFWHDMTVYFVDKIKGVFFREAGFSGD